LRERLGYAAWPSAYEEARAGSLLDDASELIRDAAGKTWLNDDESAVVDVPRPVQRICVTAAFRAYGNPQALSQRTIGDDSKSYDRAGLDGGEAVYLTPTEEARVIKAANGAASTFASVDLVSPYNGTYVDDEGDLVWA
jgi:hypothetical protein